MAENPQQSFKKMNDFEKLLWFVTDSNLPDKKSMVKNIIDLFEQEHTKRLIAVLNTVQNTASEDLADVIKELKKEISKKYKS